MLVFYPHCDQIWVFKKIELHHTQNPLIIKIELDEFSQTNPTCVISPQIKKWSLTKHLEAALCSFPSHHHQTPSKGNNCLEPFFFFFNWACAWPALASKLSLWLHWVFCDACGLSLIGVSGGCSQWWFLPLL